MRRVISQLNSFFKEVFNEFIHILGEFTEEKLDHAKKLINQGEPLTQTIAICQHIKFYRYFYKASLKDDEFIHRFTDLIYTYLYDFSGNSAISTYISYGTIGYIRKWINTDCKEPIEAIAYGMASSTFKALTESRALAQL